MKPQAKWSQIEAESCVTANAELPYPQHDVDVFRARAVDFDFRKAEALSQIAPTDPLQEIRTQIARGQMEKASAAYDAALVSDTSRGNDPEWLLESARLHMFFHRWEKALHALERLFNFSPSPVTRMTALQVRSLVLYESGNMAKANQDIEAIRSMGRLFPAAQSLFYAEALAVKILAIDADFASASRALDRLWAGELNADKILTLLRTDAHLKRHMGKNPRSVLWASVLLAAQMGDDLYAALGRLELWASGLRSIAWAKQIERDCKMHPKVLQLFNSLQIHDSNCTTANSLSIQTPDEEFPDPSQHMNSILMPSRGLLLHLSPLEFKVFARWTQPLAALTRATLDKRLSKAGLFARIVGEQKYVPHLHDGVVYQLLSRARKLTGIAVKIADAKIVVDDTWVVE